MTDRAWREAVSGDYGVAHYIDQAFAVRRILLVRGKPAAWVFSTSVGSLSNPLLWMFASTADGTRPDHLLLQVGFEGSGHFDTAFIRFHGIPFAVEIFGGESGPSAYVLSMNPGKVVCSFSPSK
jgi:hypothetical protein